MQSLSFAALALAGLATPLAASGAAETTTYHRQQVDGLSIFYREAGAPDAPVMLLLHGFPSSSHMYRDLIPILSKRFHVIAPDYPGFGQSDAPDAAGYDYDFRTLAQTMQTFTEGLGLTEYTLYMQDYGGPVGMRLAVAHPERITGLIFQNTTIHVEGWSPDVVTQFAPFWAERTPQTEAPLRQFLHPQTTRWQYEHGSTDLARLSPDTWTHDQAGLDRDGNDAIQLEYLWNYQDNVAAYPDWQDYLASARPETLIVWGQNDPFFTLEAVKGLQNLLPDAATHLYDAGHFALETHADEIGAAILATMGQ